MTSAACHNDGQVDVVEEKIKRCSALSYERDSLILV